MGDTRCVPWAEGGNGGTANQVTMLRDWDEELDPGDWWVVSQGSNREGGKKGKTRKKRKRGKPGGTFRMPGELFFHTREEAEAHLWEALGDNNGDNKGGRWVTRGVTSGPKRGVTRGVTRGVRRKGRRGVRKGVPRARMHPGNPPPRRRGSPRVAPREGGVGGRWG